MLKKRVVTALWGIPLVIIAVWFDEPISWFTVLAAVVGALGAYEFYRITGVIKKLPLVLLGILLTVLVIISPHLEWRYNPSPMLLLLAILAVLTLVLLVFRHLKKGGASDWLWMAGGVFYVGLLIAFLVILRLTDGRNFVFLALFATFGSDTLAYFIGKAFGRHKLAPQISPAKTWEGAVAGLCGAIIISLLFTLETPFQLPLSWWQAILLGLAISVFGQAGDLAESKLKRSFGVKDSGSLMPGHGGILDRIDSVLLAGVAVYLYYILVVV